MHVCRPSVLGPTCRYMHVTCGDVSCHVMMISTRLKQEFLPCTQVRVDVLWKGWKYCVARFGATCGTSRHEGFVARRGTSCSTRRDVARRGTSRHVAARRGTPSRKSKSRHDVRHRQKSLREGLATRVVTLNKERPN